MSAQQTAFYAQNGYLELEGLLTPAECETLLQAIHQTMKKRGKEEAVNGRDLWRDAPRLKTTLTSKKFQGLAFAVGKQPSLRLAFDQWFPPHFALQTPEKIERLFSIQGLVSILFIQLDPGTPEAPHTTLLGLSPFPHGQGNALLMKPSLLVNWPSNHSNIGLYCVGFCLPTSVYIHNPHDPAGISLRKLDYGYGDPLRNDSHPLLHP